MNPTTLRLAFRHYLLGLFSSAWNGGIGAVASILGVDIAAISGAADDARLLNWHEMGSAFLGAAFVAGVVWLKAHPLPEDWSTVAPWGAQRAAPPEVDKPVG